MPQNSACLWGAMRSKVFLRLLNFQASSLCKIFSLLCFKHMGTCCLVQPGLSPLVPVSLQAQNSSTPWAGYLQCPSVAEIMGNISKSLCILPQVEEMGSSLTNPIWGYNLLKVTRNSSLIRHLWCCCAVAPESPGLAARCVVFERVLGLLEEHGGFGGFRLCPSEGACLPCKALLKWVEKVASRGMALLLKDKLSSKAQLQYESCPDSGSLHEWKWGAPFSFCSCFSISTCKMSCN